MDDGLLWKALADPNRRKILDMLSTGPKTTGDLGHQLPDISRFAVMKHLGVLQSANLVTFTRHGKHRINHINAVPLRQAYERWVSRLDNNWAATATSIGRLAEQEELKSEGHLPMNSEIRQVSIHQEHQIDASPETVWAILTTRIGDWWSPPYRMFREGSQMTVELRPGGGLVEQKGDAFVFWALVTAVHPGKSLEFDGLSGPVQGRFTFSITANGKGTLLTIDHNTIESAEVGADEGYSGGWTHLATGLKDLAEAS